MIFPSVHNSGAQAKVVPLIYPVANDGTAITSTTVYADRVPAGSQQAYGSGKIYAACGVTTGTPTSFSFPFKLQHSAATASGWADYTDPSTGTVPTITLTAASSSGQVNVDLTKAERYLRLHCDGAFVDGTLPTLAISGLIVLGGATIVPVV